MSTLLRHLVAVLTVGAVLVAQAWAQQTPDVQTVVVQGVGKDPELAAKNAAENALTQVVGQFIDSEKLLSKRVEITNGIRDETKQIDTKTRAYSQGSIKSFETLNVDTKDGLVFLSARVDVRIEDFRAYIKNIAEGKTEVKEGLFARIATQSANESSVQDILVKLVSTILSGEVASFEVGEPVLASESPVRSFFRSSTGPMTCEEYKLFAATTTCDERAAYDLNWLRGRRLHFVNTEPSKSIAIPVTISLKGDFIANMQNALKNTSSQKGASITACSANALCFGYYDSVGDLLNTGKVDFYSIAGIDFDKLLPRDNPMLGLFAQIFQQDKKTVYEVELRGADDTVITTNIVAPAEYHEFVNALGIAGIKTHHPDHTDGTFPIFMVGGSGFVKPNRVALIQDGNGVDLTGFVVRRKMRAWLILTPNQEQLKATKSVVVRFKK